MIVITSSTCMLYGVMDVINGCMDITVNCCDVMMISSTCINGAIITVDVNGCIDMMICVILRVTGVTSISPTRIYIHVSRCCPINVICCDML